MLELVTTGAFRKDLKVAKNEAIICLCLKRY